MAKRVKIDDLANEITKTLQEYTDDVEKGMEKAQQATTSKGVRMLKSSSPKRTGRYAKGWASKKTSSGRVVYNKDRYQITHLLEKGHAKRGGGRVRAIVHIKPVELELIEFYEKKVIEVIKGG